jgi:predicted acyltransferase
MGAASMKLPRRMRWIAVFGVLAFHAVMTEFANWWLQFGHTTEPFWRISDPLGNMAKPLIIHCLPWVSISYGAMTMIGVLLGEAIVTGERNIITKQSILIGAVFMGLGYAIHKTGLITGHTSLCFNKPDVSASYAMFTSGLGAIVFLVLYYIMDVWRKKKWAHPFVEFGRNALLAYFMQVIMRLFFRGLHLEYFFAGKPNDALLKWADVLNSPFWSAFLLDKSGYNGILWGLIWTICLWGIIMYFNRKNIYWKL